MMSKGPDMPRRERLAAFFRRLADASPARDHDEAIRQVTDLLNQVEDEMTSIVYDPTFPLNDGRMYPPQPDSKRAMPSHSTATRYRSKGHSTIIGDNGAIQIVDHASGKVVFHKPGTDGQAV